MNCLSDICTIR